MRAIKLFGLKLSSESDENTHRLSVTSLSQTNIFRKVEEMVSGSELRRFRKMKTDSKKHCAHGLLSRRNMAETYFAPSIDEVFEKVKS